MLFWVVNVPVVYRLKAEAPNLTIYYRILSPLGLFREGIANDLGDGTYEVSFTPNMDGTWIIEFIFPDGFKVHVAIYVLPSPRLLSKGTTLALFCEAESSGLSIVARITKPDGTVETINANDRGDGTYYIVYTFDQAGTYFVEWIYPDGFSKIVVVPIFEKSPEEIEHEEIMKMLRAIFGLLSSMV